MRKNCVEVIAYAGINPTTKKKRQISVTLPRDANQYEIDQAKSRVDARAAVIMGNSAMMTVGAIFDYYIGKCKSDGMSPTTVSSYKSYLRRHIMPELGHVYFDKLDSKMLSTFLRGLHDVSGLSRASVNKIKFFMSGCFTKLMADGLINRNPMLGIKLPMATSPEAIPLSDGDFDKLTDWIDEHLQKRVVTLDDIWNETFASLINTALGTGCRRGELVGFTVGDFKDTVIDGEPAKMLRVRETLVYSNGRNSELVRKEPKSRHSKRNIAIDDLTALVIENHIELQKYLLESIGIKFCSSTPLFSGIDGHPLDPDKVTESFSALVKELGLEPTTHLHTLRHTHATRLLEDGVDIVTLQERLGHESAKTTMDVYGHVMPGRDFAAAKRYSKMRSVGVGQGLDKYSSPHVPTCPLSGNTCARFTAALLDN